MTKPEKVIKGLKCHTETGCDECPYDKTFTIDNITCVKTLAFDALNLLEEQEKKIKINDLTAKIYQDNLFELQEEIRQLHNLSESLKEREND